MSDVTLILSQIESGDPRAAKQLLPLVYGELRKLAAARLAQEKPGQSLQSTDLVRDAYIRLVDVEKVQDWNSRGHFCGAAAEAMRRILVENTRRKDSEKRGGTRQPVDLLAADLDVANREELLAVNEALDRFAARWPEKAELVKLRYFVGLTIPEASEAIGVSRATGERYWTFARLAAQPTEK